MSENIEEIKKTRKVVTKGKTYYYEPRTDITAEDRQKYSANFYKNHKGLKKHCEVCNCEISYYNFSSHKKTSKHIKNLNKVC